MSFYTALTGLNGAQSDISATSNNIEVISTLRALMIRTINLGK